MLVVSVLSLRQRGRIRVGMGFRGVRFWMEGFASQEGMGVISDDWTGFVVDRKGGLGFCIGKLRVGSELI